MSHKTHGLRLGGNRSATVTMTRGEFNRKLKATRADGVVEGEALMKKRVLMTIGKLRKQHGMAFFSADVLVGFQMIEDAIKGDGML